MYFCPLNQFKIRNPPMDPSPIVRIESVNKYQMDRLEVNFKVFYSIHSFNIIPLLSINDFIVLYHIGV